MTKRKELDQLPQAFNASKLSVPPEVELDGEWIAWRWREYFGSVIGNEVTAEGLLNRFCKIKTAEDACDFAKIFGPLGICAHGNPICHAGVPGGGLLYDPEQGEQSGVQVVSAPSAEAFYCSPVRLSDGRLAERVEWWLKLAGAMDAGIKVATCLQQARRPQPKDLAVLYKSLVYDLSQPPVVEQILPADQLAEEAELFGTDGLLVSEIRGARIDGLRSNAWALILELLNKWLIACPTRLYFTFTDSRPVDFSMAFIAGDQRGCFPALVFELVGRIRATKGKWMVNCAHCKVLVSPRREPQEGARVFCQACRTEGWPARFALRAYYARNREKILVIRKRKRLAENSSRE